MYWYAWEWQLLTMKIGMGALKNPDVVGVASVEYLMYSGYVELARHWLMVEKAAVDALASGNGKQEKGFYEAKIQTSKFMFENLLPRTQSLKTAMFTPVDTVM